MMKSNGWSYGRLSTDQSRKVHWTWINPIKSIKNARMEVLS